MRQAPTSNDDSLILPKLPGVAHDRGRECLQKYGKRPVVKNPLLLGM
jgi:hypothetical protein